MHSQEQPGVQRFLAQTSTINRDTSVNHHLRHDNIRNASVRTPLLSRSVNDPVS